MEWIIGIMVVLSLLYVCRFHILWMFCDKEAGSSALKSVDQALNCWKKVKQSNTPMRHREEAERHLRNAIAQAEHARMGGYDALRFWRDNDPAAEGMFAYYDTWS